MLWGCDAACEKVISSAANKQNTNPEPEPQPPLNPNNPNVSNTNNSNFNNSTHCENPDNIYSASAPAHERGDINSETVNERKQQHVGPAGPFRGETFSPYTEGLSRMQNKASELTKGWET